MPLRIQEFASDVVRLKWQGIIDGSALVNSTTNFDWKVPESRYIEGVEYILSEGNLGDQITLQVVDKDNVMGYGANVVLDEFGTDLYIQANAGYKQYTSTYPALLPPNVYIRIKYKNNSLTVAVRVLVNIKSHIPK